MLPNEHPFPYRLAHEAGTQEVQTMQETQAAAREPIRTMFVNAPSWASR